ncbi:hypothetical protein [Micromonospora sp. NPDC002717]|uniref:hypothetical protein n=1 Tax=Micromonospora sp. NPDC002717 TaxID=3154424 RepID=UPI00331833D2
MQEGRWTTITPSQFTHEREALAHVQALLPDTEPYRAWSNFTFTAQTGHQDGAVVRVGDNEWIALPDAWIVNAHRSAVTA